MVSVTAEVEPVSQLGVVLAAATRRGSPRPPRHQRGTRCRVQFDRPIGANQAIKHPCADMAVRAELAWAQTLFAALATDERRQDAEFTAVAAKVVAADAAERNGGDRPSARRHGLQVRARCQPPLKRAHVLGRAFSDTRDALSRLIRLPAALQKAAGGDRRRSAGGTEPATPFELLARSSRAALADAGLAREDVDGVASTALGTMAPIDGERVPRIAAAMDRLHRGWRRSVGGRGRDAVDAIAEGHAESCR